MARVRDGVRQRDHHVASRAEAAPRLGPARRLLVRVRVRLLRETRSRGIIIVSGSCSLVTTAIVSAAGRLLVGERRACTAIVM